MGPSCAPAAKDPDNCASTTGGRKLRVFPSHDWAGMAMVYFHADLPDAPPAFELPPHVTKQLDEECWRPRLRVDLGRLALSPIDWVSVAVRGSVNGICAAPVPCALSCASSGPTVGSNAARRHLGASSSPAHLAG